MVKTFRKLLELLTPKERKRFYLLFAMMIVSGIVEMATISAMFPFLAIVANPGIVETNGILAGIYGFLGFADVKSFLAFTGASVFLIVVFGLMFATLTQYAIYRFAALCGASMGRRLLRGYLRKPYSWFLNQHSSKMESSILSDVNEIVDRCLLPGMKIIAQASVAILLIALLVAAEPVAAVVASILIGGVYSAIYVVVRKQLALMGQLRKESSLEKYKVTGEALGGIKDVKLLGLEDVFVRRFERPAMNAAVATAAVNVISEVPRNALRAVMFGGILFFIVVMLVRGDGNLTALLPILGLYAFAGLRLLPALQQIYMGFAHLRFAQPMLERMHADITTNLPAAGETQAPPDRPAIRLRERLELRDVHYTYPEAERGALDGFDLVIAARTTVGVVGGTGAGKTTAVDLILGLLRPAKGALVVDGVPVADADMRGWQKSIGYVPQHIFLTDDTVTANIAFGVEPGNVDHAAVERAARVAELHDFVLKDLPQGYGTMLGERGVRLSGGQRQRIGIARALYHDPDVLVLDEATSALDNLTERAVMDAVHNLGHHKTIIMIAHRLSTVRDCDRIFLLERGRVVAEGSYDQLVETNDEFRRMVGGGRN